MNSHRDAIRRPPKWGRWWAVAGVLAAAAAGSVVWVSSGGGGEASVTPSPMQTSVTEPVAAAVAGQKLVLMWESTEPPCENPVIAAGTPDNESNLIGGMYPTTGDVAAKLAGIRAHGDADFVRGRLEALDVALLKTQRNIFIRDEMGTAAVADAAGDAGVEQTTIQQMQADVRMLRHQFDTFTEHIIYELSVGHMSDSAITNLFPVSAVCP